MFLSKSFAFLVAEWACQWAKKSKEKQDEVKDDKNLLGYPTTDENRHTFKCKTRTPDDIPMPFYWTVGFYLKVINSSALRRKICVGFNYIIVKEYSK